MVDERPEAREWLAANANVAGFASNHFASPQVALAFVARLYAAGAVRVAIDGIDDRPETLAYEGGPYADELLVTLPDGEDASARIYQVVVEESPDECIREGNILRLWWD